MRASRYPAPVLFERPALVAALIASVCFPSAVAQNAVNAPGGRQSESHPYRELITKIDRDLSSVKSISQVNLSRDGSVLAWSVEGPKPETGVIRVAAANALGTIKRVTAGDSRRFCDESSAVWSPGAKSLALLSDCRTPGRLQLFVLGFRENLAAGRARQLTNVTGFISHPEWSPDGKTIAYLFVDHATRAPNPMAAIHPPTGVIDDQQNREVQRLALTDVSSGTTRILTPPALNLYEFDWAPDGKRLVYTAAPPPGDDNWYNAQLYTQKIDGTTARPLYKPRWQIAVPRWSPDGESIAFIEGLMSDEGATGGEIYVISAAGGAARDLTPNRRSSPSWLAWRSDRSILFSEYAGGSVAVSSLDLVRSKTVTLWKGGETISADPESTSLSLAQSIQDPAAQPPAAVIRSSWSAPPEVWFGPIGNWHQVSRENSSFRPPPARAESVSWTRDSFQVQGWLLFPRHFDPAKRYPMIVSVHGGPAWIFTPGWAASDFDLEAFSALGYFIFFPNPRGSFGQGENFTQANRRDWGFGDLRDILTGVDAVLAHYPIDRDKVGITGWSYGGSTSMFAVTQTDRFRAAVAGAAACNLLSYYGENSIDQWMLPYFGASVYDDPAAYLRSSAITYVKKVKTPTLILVGELDGEAPPAQSFEFWHALKELHVPTQLVVYPGEGHGFANRKNRVDLIERSLGWFMRFMPPD